MKAILIGDNEDIQILEGSHALFLTNGIDGSPAFIECECGHVITAQAAGDNDGSDPCPKCQ